VIKYQCSGWLKYKKGSSDLRGFTYTYDASGNITKIVTEGTNVPQAALTKEYTYDALGQLATEVNGSGTTFGYAYDTAGNIRNITKDGTVTKSFGYTNPSWPDLLTSVTSGSTTKDILYEGQTQTSGVPSSGNPVTYYNGKDYTFTWTKGRQLASATVDGKQVSYAYDMAGVRSSKQVGDTTYTYTTLSGKVMRQTWGDNNALEFVYDDGNQPFAMIYNDGSTSTLYYYVLNAQGDVIALLNANGKLAASYDYDAWGNCTVYDSSAKVLTDPTSIANLNPLRYRGYYYDAETGFYYLQSRYYDPAICRFINADGLFTDGFIGANLFAYCANNPVNTVDPTGNFAITATVALITFGVALVATAFAVGISSSPGFQGAVEGLCESVGDIAGQIKEKLTNSFSKIKKPPNYRSNKEVHHIVAQRAPGAAPAQKILAELEIGINDPVNTVSINTCLHRRLHTKLYYELVNIVIVGAYNSAGGDREQQIENVTSALKAIRSFIFVLDRTTPKF
jgi:RHS repeat-associated protein